MKPALLPLALALLIPAAHAATPEATPAPAVAPAPGPLDVGSPAPAFKPAQWIQGEPVTAFEKDKTYLIECWATWCGPCVGMIPHVNALHSKFKDKGLVVIGVDVREEPADKAAAFVKTKGDAMAYRVAYDGGNSGDIAKHWLAAAGKNGIPHTFVVRDGKILWQGHPGGLNDENVAAMIAGKFDAAKALEDRKLEERHQELTKKFTALIARKKTAEAAEVLARKNAIASRITPGEAALEKSEGEIEIALADGDLKSAAERIRAFAEAGATRKEDRESQYRVATWHILDERLAGSRDYALALACLDRYLASDPRAVRVPFVRYLRAHALYGVGKKADAILELETNTASPALQNEITLVLGLLKDDKPWPDGKLNLGVRRAPAPTPAKAPNP